MLDKKEMYVQCTYIGREKKYSKNISIHELFYIGYRLDHKLFFGPPGTKLCVLSMSVVCIEHSHVRVLL